MNRLTTFIRNLVQKLALLLGFVDKNKDGKIDTKEFLMQLTFLIIQAGYYVNPISNSDVDKILKFFNIDNIEMLKDIHLADIIKGLIELGIISKK